jgi:hypothetical protein
VVIQASKGKSFDIYRAHLAKSVGSWCCSHHIERNKSFFLDSKFFEDLVTFRFNSGGQVVQYTLATQGMLMLACQSLMAVEAEYWQKYKEADSHTRKTCSIDELMKGNCGKNSAPTIKLHGHQTQHWDILFPPLIHFRGPLQFFQ